MKKITVICFISIMISLFISPLQAQDVRLVKTKVADILMQVPAKNQAQLEKLITELNQAGDDALAEMFAMLRAPGQGDDAAARYMLTSMARYAARPDKRQEWERIQAPFLKAIQTAADKEVQAYLVEQLLYGANDKCVDLLAPLLADERLCEPVAALFRSLGAPKAELALQASLTSPCCPNRVTLVKHLGDMHSISSISLITNLAAGDDPATKPAAVRALAEIGSPASYALLEEAAEQAAEQGDHELSAAFLRYADRLGETRELKLCRKACLESIEIARKSGQLSDEAAALSVFAHHLDGMALPLLLKAAVHTDKAFRCSVLATASTLRGENYTKKWTDKAAKAENGPRADILHMLGERGDKTALPFVTGQLEHASGDVRAEAVWALVKLAGKEATKPLLDHLVSGRDAAETEKALSTLLDEKELDQVAALTETAPLGVKPSLIRLIGAKSGKRFFGKVYAAASANDDALKTAAFAALPSVTSPENLKLLLRLIPSTDNPQNLENLQKAIVVAAGAVEDPGTAMGLILADFKKSSMKIKYIPVLSAIGGGQALDAVAGLFRNSEGALRGACAEALVNWSDPAASVYLFQICSDPSSAFRAEAFAGYISQVVKSSWPGDQKLLKLQAVMPLAVENSEREKVISALAGVKTYLSLVFLGQYLEDPQLQQAAAASLITVGLPSEGRNDGFSGEIPKNLLTQAAAILKGPESDYTREKVRKYLESLPGEPGFVPMFNGKDLTGWKGYITDPISLSRLTPQQKAARQAEADRKMSENWSVRDGMIVFTGEGNNLLSTKDYGNFELFVNWKIGKKGDSGIYLRGTPQVQIWDTSRTDAGAQVGSGGLYNNQVNASQPLKVADNPVGEWNTFHIYMTGDKVTVYLNGELVVDNTVLENYWDRNLPVFPAGTIELQAHGTDLAFKDIYVREIQGSEALLTPQEKAEGFVSLFNGKNLDGWVGDKVNYKAGDGMIVIEPTEGGGGNLYTENEYADFDFRFEFRLTPAANNGLGIRAPLEGDAAYVGMELQILDNDAPVYAELKPYQYHGSVYGVIPALRGYLKPVGEWNSEEVIVKGKKVTVILNGTVIVDGDIEEASRNGTMDHNEHPGLLRDKGHIVFLGHGSVVKFRNIRVKPL